MVSLGFYDNNDGKTALGANIAQQDTACSMFFMAEDSRRSWLHFLNACSSPRGGRAVPADVCCGGGTGLRRDEANGCGNREAEEEFEEMTRVKAGVRWVRQQLMACSYNRRHRGSSTVWEGDPQCTAGSIGRCRENLWSYRFQCFSQRAKVTFCRRMESCCH